MAESFGRWFNCFLLEHSFFVNSLIRTIPTRRSCVHQCWWCTRRECWSMLVNNVTTRSDIKNSKNFSSAWPTVRWKGIVFFPIRGGSRWEVAMLVVLSSVLFEGHLCRVRSIETKSRAIGGSTARSEGWLSEDLEFDP